MRTVPKPGEGPDIETLKRLVDLHDEPDEIEIEDDPPDTYVSVLAPGRGAPKAMFSSEGSRLLDSFRKKANDSLNEPLGVIESYDDFLKWVNFVARDGIIARDEVIRLLRNLERDVESPIARLFIQHTFSRYEAAQDLREEMILLQCALSALTHLVAGQPPGELVRSYLMAMIASLELIERTPKGFTTSQKKDHYSSTKEYWIGVHKAEEAIACIEVFRLLLEDGHPALGPIETLDSELVLPLSEKLESSIEDLDGEKVKVQAKHRIRDAEQLMHKNALILTALRGIFDRVQDVPNIEREDSFPLYRVRNMLVRRVLKSMAPEVHFSALRSDAMIFGNCEIKIPDDVRVYCDTHPSGPQVFAVAGYADIKDGSLRVKPGRYFTFFSVEGSFASGSEAGTSSPSYARPIQKGRVNEGLIEILPMNVKSTATYVHGDGRTRYKLEIRNGEPVFIPARKRKIKHDRLEL